MSTMKVVHLGHVPLPPDHPDLGRIPSHPGRWVLNHALAQLRTATMDVEVVTMAHKASCDFVTDCEGVRVHFLRTFHPYRAFTGFILDRWRLARYVRLLRPDVVHSHGTEDVYSLAAQWTGLPYVITVQGLLFQILQRVGDRSVMARVVRHLEHRTLMRARYVVAKSEYVRDGLKEAFPHLDLRLIPNTYQPELDCPLVAKEPNTLAFVGTLDHRKGVHRIVASLPKVLAAIPQAQLWVFGDSKTPTEYEAAQLDHLHALLGPRLRLFGKLRPEALFDALGPCTALLAPSLEEMFGNQLIEGLMRGCHGIVTDQTALAENVRRFGNGTVVPQDDSAALADAIVRTLRNPPRAEIQEAARCAIRGYMGPHRVAAEHRALYGELLVATGRSIREPMGE